MLRYCDLLIKPVNIITSVENKLMRIRKRERKICQNIFFNVPQQRNGQFQRKKTPNILFRFVYPTKSHRNFNNLVFFSRPRFRFRNICSNFCPMAKKLFLQHSEFFFFLLRIKKKISLLFSQILYSRKKRKLHTETPSRFNLVIEFLGKFAE